MEKQLPKIDLDHIPAGFYSEFTEQWLSGSASLESVFPQKGFSIEQLGQSYQFYDKDRRIELCDVLMEQYKQVGVSPAASVHNIDLLRNEHTFCITTGQQLHIYLGPQFVLYKIWSVIRQAARFTRLYPQYRFVPVFWMAGEDHDTDEIDHVKVFQKQYNWDLEGRRGGAVGRLSTAGLTELTDQIQADLHLPDEDLLDIFRKYYAESKSFADATQALLLHFFGQDGLIVLNPDSANFKKHLSGLVESDLSGMAMNEAISRGSENLRKAGFKPAIGSRSTQLFMFEQGKRLRLDRDGQDFLLGAEKLRFQKNELVRRVLASPQDFSPNALLRPLYQQLILPCAGYVCGPAELVYWHQLHEALVHYQIPVPKLLLRDSFCFCDKTTQKHLDKLNLDRQFLWEGFEKSSAQLQNRLFGELRLDERLEATENSLEELFNSLHSAGSRDLKSLRKDAKELIKSVQNEVQKVSHELRIKSEFVYLFQRLEKLCTEVFSKEKPQERKDFLLPYYLKLGNFNMPQNYVSRGESHLFGTLSEG